MRKAFATLLVLGVLPVAAHAQSSFSGFTSETWS